MVRAGVTPPRSLSRLRPSETSAEAFAVPSAPVDVHPWPGTKTWDINADVFRQFSPIHLPHTLLDIASKMKDLPVELVDMVVEELLDLVGTPNSYSGSRCDQRHSDGISRYSTVSKRWANLTREHHFETVCFDKPAMLKRWTTCIPADPDGVSRYVRDLALNQVDPSELEKHLHAFTNLESLSFFKCEGVLQLPFIKDWFTLVGGSLVELRLSVLLTPQHIIASLLAELPVLEILDTYELGFPGEQDEPTPADPPRIPFFEGDNQFILYFAIRVGWVPPNPQFGQLEMDTHSLRKVLEVVKPPSRWFASSSTTLKDLVITADEGDTHSTSRPGAGSMVICPTN